MSTLKKPKKNCRLCLGRGSVTLILAKDKAGNDVKETKPCICLNRVSDNNWPEKKR